MSQPITNADLIEAAGISPSYASMILKGRRPCPPIVALKVFRRFGVGIGPLENATATEIAVFEKLNGLADDAHVPGVNAEQGASSPDNRSENVGEAA